MLFKKYPRYDSPEYDEAEDSCRNRSDGLRPRESSSNERMESQEFSLLRV